MYTLIINLKTYEEATGKNLNKITSAVKKLQYKARKSNVQIILAVPAVDISSVEGVNVYSQHVDPFEYGAHTGYVLPTHVKNAGARGTLLSHSEKYLDVEQIKKTLPLIKKAGLQVCVCARDVKRAKELSKLNVDFIAVEPPELIGGDISVSTAKPGLISNSVKACGKKALLVGAGVKNAQDVRVAVQLGAKGILVASGVIKAKNTEKAIDDLLNGFAK